MRKITFLLVVCFMFGMHLLAAEGDTITSGYSITSSLPAIDDDFTDWDHIDSLTLDSVSKGTADPSDIAAFFKTTWSKNTFYFYINITDDVAGTNFHNATNHDNLQLYFDMDNSKIVWSEDEAGGQWTPLYDENDHQIRVDRDLDGYSASDDFPLAGAITISKVETDTGWAVELSIPFDSLMMGFLAMNDSVIGFDVMVGDNDDTGDGDGKKESVIALHDGTNNVWKDASLMGNMMLIGSPNTFLNAAIELPDAIIIDTIFDDWDAYEADSLKVFSDGETTNDDLSVSFKSTFDTKNIYFMVDVTDDVAGTNFHNETNHDNIELYFDMDNSKIVWNQDEAGGQWTPLYDDNDYQIRINRDIDGYNVRGEFPTEDAVQIAKKETATGWAIELSIPLDSLMAGFIPDNGTLIGFDLMVGDNDDTGSGDGKKESVIAYNDGTNKAWKDASTMGLMHLTGEAVYTGMMEAVSEAYTEGNSIQLDGDFSDWDGFEANALTRFSKGATTSDDLSVTYKTTFNADSIFFMVDVVDDIAGTNFHNETNHDNIELYFDMDNSKLVWSESEAGGQWTPLYDANDHQIRIDRDVDGYAPSDDFPATDGMAISKVETETGWAVEVAIPFESLMADFAAEDGKIIGFDLMAGDNDDTGDGDGKKESVIALNDYTNKVWKDASQMGILTFSGTGVASNPNAIALNSLENVKVYPAIATHSVNVANAANVASVSIISVDGRLINEMDNDTSDNLTIDVSSLQGGIYFIILSDKENNKTAVRFIKD